MSPTMLIDALQGVRRRVRVLGVAFGVGIVLTAAVGLLLLTVLLDYMLNLPASPRLLLILASIGGIGFALYEWIIRPLASRLTLGDIAGRLERAFPQFDDRLRSTVDFLGGGVPGSELMQDRVVGEASRIAQEVDLRRAVVARPVAASLGTGIGAILIAALLAWVVPPQYFQIALSRLLTPFNGEAWPKRVQIDLVGEMPRRVPVGQRVEVKMRLLKGDKPSMRALVYYRYGDGPEQQEYMTRAADGTYVASLDARADHDRGGELRVWMKAGDDSMVLDPITVVPRLAVRSVTASIQPPPYVDASQHPDRQYDLTQAPAVLAVGSRVTLHVQFNKPLEGDVMIEPSSEEARPPQATIEPAAPFGAAITWAATDSLRFHLRATDTDGFRNIGLEEYELIVRPDQNPTVQIDHPRRNEDRTPVATIPLDATAEDDYGIQSLKLVVNRLDDQKRWEIDLVTSDGPVQGVEWRRIEGVGDRRRFRMNYAWDLAQLAEADLRPGQVLEYFILAQDNFYLNGESHDPVPSGKLRINLISQEQLVNAVTQELRNLAHQVNEVRNNQNRTMEETAGLQKDTEGKLALDASDRAVAERLANQQSTMASQTKQLSNKLGAMRSRMEENKSPAEDLQGTMREVEEQLDNAAEGAMKRAANEINAAKDQNAAEQRKATLESVGRDQQDASDQLQRALDRMGNLGSLQQSIERVRQLLERQREVSRRTAEIGRENLGKRPEDMSPEDRQKLEDNAAEQERLARETEKAMDEMREMGEQMEKSDPATADAMKKAAQTGGQQQVSQNQQKASQQSRQNRQSGAQAAQKQAEIGLQMMLSDLRAGERRKLEELQKKLAELQQQIAQLIRRQAGHNLDNLSIQGPDIIAAIEENLREELLAKAERIKEALPPVPTLPQLSGGQELTERNTRDIGKTAEDFPDGAAAAAHLIRAAGRMERAIVSLRERKLPDAYAPSQVEALAALEDARRKVDEQQAEVTEQLDNQQKEAIRQAYIKIREEQAALNRETARIEDARRGPERTLDRPDAIRLGKLPGEQGALGDRIGEMGKDLEALGSIVYVWANKDIVSAMSKVKERLGEPDTTRPTQDRQARVLRQLDAMIEALVVKPKESRFEQGGGSGGGGGQSAARLPTEAELRLLQGLQADINDTTREIDAAAAKDKDRLGEVGERQGEMRDLLDQLLRTASQGKVRLRPEPDNRDMLPEEAGIDAIEDQELEQDLLAGDPNAEGIEKETNLIGDRMARSKQRLVLNKDPGKVTQAIQERILLDFDDLIDQARQQQQQQSQASTGRQQGEQMQQRPAGGAQPDNQQAASGVQQPAGSEAATESTVRPGGDVVADLSGELAETMSEWGALTPRQREAIIENSGETTVEKYRNLIEDYYRSLAIKGKE